MKNYKKNNDVTKRPKTSTTDSYRQPREIACPKGALIFLEAQKNKNLCKSFSFPLIL